MHNAQELGCCRSLSSFPLIVCRLREILERFHQVLSSVDACFIDEGTLERLPLPAQLGATRVGGIDFNQARMRHVVEAVVALSPSPGGFAASQLAGKVRSLTGQAQSEYGPRRAAYDLKKLRAKRLARRIESTHRYEATPEGLRTQPPSTNATEPCAWTCKACFKSSAWWHEISTIHFSFLRPSGLDSVVV